MNAGDAERLGVEDGEPVVLQRKKWRIEVKASVGDKVNPGVLWSPRPILDSAGNAQNSLVPGLTQTLGGGPHYN